MCCPSSSRIGSMFLPVGARVFTQPSCWPNKVWKKKKINADLSVTSFSLLSWSGVMQLAFGGRGWLWEDVSLMHRITLLVFPPRVVFLHRISGYIVSFLWFLFQFSPKGVSSVLRWYSDTLHLGYSDVIQVLLQSIAMEEWVGAKCPKKYFWETCLRWIFIRSAALLHMKTLGSFVFSLGLEFI